MRSLKLALPLLFALACGSTDGVTLPDGGQAVAPSVSSTIPAASSTSVAVNLPITATFNHAMDAATLSATSFVLRQGSTVVPAAVTYAGMTAALTPSAPLAANTSYTATVTAASKDPAGLALAADYAWTFTTVAEGASPAVSSTRPANNAVDVFTGQQITATFNQVMDPLTLTAATFTVQQGAASVAGQVSYDAASNTAKFAPSA